MEKDTLAKWLNRYIEAWRSYNPQAISDLFTEDATYAYHPWDEPIKGREAIVANWLKSPDAPDKWEAQYEPYAVDGDTAVATGWTHYFGEDQKTIERAYYNVWLLRFRDGVCSEFVETYMDMPKKEA